MTGSRHTALVEIRDDLDGALQLYEAAYMAAKTLQPGEREPICAVMDHAASKLMSAKRRLGAIADQGGAS